jgi:glycosyltransferase involved in cell wall biosynthesis
MMDVTVIIPVFNRAEMLSKRLQELNVLGRQLNIIISVIIVDDFSKELIKLQFYEMLKLKLIRHLRNRGAAAARNTGVNAARTTWISFLDSDDCLFKDKFLILNEKKYQSVDGIIGGQQALTSCGDTFEINNNPQSYNLKKELVRGWVPNNPSSVLIKREAYIKIGGMNENLETCEDHQFWLNAIINHDLDIKIEDRIFSQFYNHSRERLSLQFETRISSVKIFLKSIEKYFDNRKDYKKFSQNYWLNVLYPFLFLRRLNLESLRIWIICFFQIISNKQLPCRALKKFKKTVQLKI